MSEYETDLTLPNVVLKSNWLYVDGRKLRTTVLDHSPEKAPISADRLSHLLELSRFAILDGIINSSHPSPSVSPSILTLHVASEQQAEGRDGKVFTDKGYENGGVNDIRDNIREPFRTYWDSIKAVGFRPEVHRTSGKKDGGAWMAFRRPTLMQVSKDWVGYREPTALAKIRTTLEADTGDPVRSYSGRAKRLLLDVVRGAQQEFIDVMDDELKYMNFATEARVEFRTKQQVGSLLAGIAFKQTLEYGLGQDEDIEDVLAYASDSTYIDEGSVRAIENALY